MLHFARLLVIDDLRPELGVADRPSLQTNYLLFIAAIDGQLDDFLDCLYEADPQFVHDVWGRCLGYSEGQQGPVFFRRYIGRSRMPVQLPYVAFRNETALDIRSALEIHAEMLDWLAKVRCSRMDDTQLMSEWQDLQAQFFTGAKASR